MIGVAWLVGSPRPRLHIVRWSGSGSWRSLCSYIGELRQDPELGWPLVRERKLWHRPEGRVLERSYDLDDLPPLLLCRSCVRRHRDEAADVEQLVADHGL